jgi:hypothetical protein
MSVEEPHMHTYGNKVRDKTLQFIDHTINLLPLRRFFCQSSQSK